MENKIKMEGHVGKLLIYKYTKICKYKTTNN